MSQRPMGITMLAVIALLNGIFSFSAGVVLLLGGSLGMAAQDAQGMPAMLVGAAMFAVGLASFVAGFGLWTKRRWAVNASTAVFGAGILVNVFAVLFASASVLTVSFPTAVAVIVLWYLHQPATKSALVA